MTATPVPAVSLQCPGRGEEARWASGAESCDDVVGDHDGPVVVGEHGAVDLDRAGFDALAREGEDPSVALVKHIGWRLVSASTSPNAEFPTRSRIWYSLGFVTDSRSIRAGSIAIMKRPTANATHTDTTKAIASSFQRRRRRRPGVAVSVSRVEAPGMGTPFVGTSRTGQSSGSPHGNSRARPGLFGRTRRTGGVRSAHAMAAGV